MVMQESIKTKYFLKIPNKYIWDRKNSKTSGINEYDKNLIAILKYIDLSKNRLGYSIFTLEDLILLCGLKPKNGVGKVNERFKNLLIALTKDNILIDVDDSIKNCKINSCIKCQLNMGDIDREFFLLYDYEFEIIFNGDFENKTTLLNTYCYIKSRIYKRSLKEEKEKEYCEGWKPEVCYPRYEDITNDLKIGDKQLKECLDYLREQELLFSDNIGIVTTLNGSKQRANNVYALNREELKQGLSVSYLYYTGIDCSVEKNKTTRNNHEVEKTELQHKIANFIVSINMMDNYTEDIRIKLKNGWKYYCDNKEFSLTKYKNNYKELTFAYSKIEELMKGNGLSVS